MESIPLKATVLKQNLGVSSGGVLGCVIMSSAAFDASASVREDFFHRRSARMRLVTGLAGVGSESEMQCLFPSLETLE